MIDEPILFEQLELGWRRANRLWWLVAAALAWIVLELTAEPAWAALIACAKVGWPDLRCAWWLRRRDPNPIRGSTLFWCYAGRGLMWISGIAAVSSIVMGSIAAVCDAFEKAVPILHRPLAVTALLATFSFSLACIVTLIGIAKAVRQRVRIWMHSQVGVCCRHDEWPPPYDPHSNRTATLEWALCAVILFFGCCSILWMAIDCKVPQGRLAAASLALAFSGLLIAMVVGSLVSCHWIRKRVAAQQPYECWPELFPGCLRQFGKAAL